MRRILLSVLAPALLIAVMLPSVAGAITSTFPTLAATTCVGNISGSKDASLIPNGPVVVVASFGKFIKSDQPPFYTAAKGKPDTATVDWGMYLTGNGTTTCTTQNDHGQTATAGSANICVQSTALIGTYVYNKVGTYSNLNFTFEDLPALDLPGEPSPTGGDPLDGCTGTFTIIPYGKKLAANYSLSSLNCATASKASMQGVQMTLSCVAF